MSIKGNRVPSFQALLKTLLHFELFVIEINQIEKVQCTVNYNSKQTQIINALLYTLGERKKKHEVLNCSFPWHLSDTVKISTFNMPFSHGTMDN